jgi:predicted CopG family antitoxin
LYGWKEKAEFVLLTEKHMDSFSEETRRLIEKHRGYMEEECEQGENYDKTTRKLVPQHYYYY